VGDPRGRSKFKNAFLLPKSSNHEQTANPLFESSQSSHYALNIQHRNITFSTMAKTLLAALVACGLSVLAIAASAISTTDATVQAILIAFGLAFAGLAFAFSAAASTAGQNPTVLSSGYLLLEQGERGIARKKGMDPIPCDGTPATAQILKVDQGSADAKDMSSNADPCALEAASLCQ
jgi:hypothetical protein